jgi:hypothetical protein
MFMQRTGLVRVSSMMPFATPASLQRQDFRAAPWATHWSRLCEHDLAPRLKKYPNGVRAKMQCKLCGQGVGSLIPLKGVTEEWDESLESLVQEQYDAACKEWREQNVDAPRLPPGERPESWWEMYNRYLCSAVWQTKRELVMQRCGGVCESCGQAAAEQVHHLEYPETFGMEPLWDLRAVCVPCHKIIHPHMR